MSDKILIFMPAYNEEKVIDKVIREVKKEGFKDILVVDDCSKDNTAKVAQKAGAIVLRHPINRHGPGGPTATGIEFARREGYDYMVLMDSDGQHSPKDIKKLLKYSKKYDVIIGSRMINGNKGDMPAIRRFANTVGSLITAFFFGTYIKDSQSGFRVFNRKAIEKTDITFDGFEFWSETQGAIKKHKMSFIEVPIKIIYTDHSLSKGQTIKNGFRMISKFIFKS